jgi:hypothetical protein
MSRRVFVILLLADFLAYVPNFPEMGLETRPASMVSPLMMAIYMVAIFLPLVTIPVTFKWPRVAGGFAILCGVLNIVPSVLDLSHMLFPLPPPRVIAFDEILLIVIGGALCTLGYRALSPSS